MKDIYIIDSSLWIELERKNKRVEAKIIPLILKNSVCLVDIIIAEVLRGTQNLKDYNYLKEHFLSFPILSTNWLQVSKLAFEIAKLGYHPPLTDLYIAQCALKSDKILITQDKHFAQIAKVKPLKLDLI